MVLGCHIGDCHYISGNHRAAKRLALLKEMLGYVGVNPDRLLVDWVSASEGSKFQRLVTAFIEQVRELGPYQSEDGGGRSEIMDLPSDAGER